MKWNWKENNFSELFQGCYMMIRGVKFIMKRPWNCFRIVSVNVRNWNEAICLFSIAIDFIMCGWLHWNLDLTIKRFSRHACNEELFIKKRSIWERTWFNGNRAAGWQRLPIFGLLRERWGETTGVAKRMSVASYVASGILQFQRLRSIVNRTRRQTTTCLVLIRAPIDPTKHASSTSTKSIITYHRTVPPIADLTFDYLSILSPYISGNFCQSPRSVQVKSQIYTKLLICVKKL
jgi:hypothetical protein